MSAAAFPNQTIQRAKLPAQRRTKVPSGEERLIALGCEAGLQDGWRDAVSGEERPKIQLPPRYRIGFRALVEGGEQS